jgi:hypothetical protein
MFWKKIKTWFESHSIISIKVEGGGVNNDGCLGLSLAHAIISIKVEGGGVNNDGCLGISLAHVGLN